VMAAMGTAAACSKCHVSPASAPLTHWLERSHISANDPSATTEHLVARLEPRWTLFPTASTVAREINAPAGCLRVHHTPEPPAQHDVRLAPHVVPVPAG